MKTREKFLASVFFTKLIKLTFGVNVVKIRKIIPGLTKWSNCFNNYGSDDFNCQYQVYAYSILGFQELDVVSTNNYYEVDDFSSTRTVCENKSAKYSNLANALIAQSPDAIFIVVVRRIINDGDCDDKYATIYSVPDLTKYLKK